MFPKQDLGSSLDQSDGGIFFQVCVYTSHYIGHIRSLCVTPDGTTMAVGFSSGFLSLVDLRGGILTRQWKAHEADIIRVMQHNVSNVVTLSSDVICQLISVFRHF